MPSLLPSCRPVAGWLQTSLRTPSLQQDMRHGKPIDTGFQHMFRQPAARALPYTTCYFDVPFDDITFTWGQQIVSSYALY